MSAFGGKADITRTTRIRIEGQIMPDKPENSAFKLLSSRKTLIMATADKNGALHVSYAPFVHRAPRVYVYTSSLSRIPRLLRNKRPRCR
jgi:hypothetical protein